MRYQWYHPSDTCRYPWSATGEVKPLENKPEKKSDQRYPGTATKNPTTLNNGTLTTLQMVPGERYYQLVMFKKKKWDILM